ncbi:MAG: hypothetical protein ACPLRJ_07875 [Infirmifilum uzonense]|uniref:hypothetical protein n=1 Tax=Infirmifilum uzonense TaxID=1550241 RepID=UPI003C79508A
MATEKRGFREWKALTMVTLVTLAQKYPERRPTIESLAARLQHLKARDLTQFLFQLHLLSYDVPEAAGLIPSADEVERWLKGDEE